MNNHTYPKEHYLSWLKVLDSGILTKNLINCALFILSYELFKQSVIGHPKGFFCTQYRNGKLKISERYKELVLDINPKDVFNSSCIWFKENGAIGENDLYKISTIRKHRNELVHEIPNFIAGNKNLQEKLFDDLYILLSKIDRWWLINIEVPTDPDFDNQKIDEDQTFSGNMILLDMIKRILTGDDYELSELKNLVLNKINQNTP